MQFLMIQRCFHSSTRIFRSTPRGQFKLPADPTTTTYRGKLFEWQTLNAFESIGMQLRHIGGRSDGGIDLKGHWTLILGGNDDIDQDDDNTQQNDLLEQQCSNDNKMIPVVVQCKNIKTGCTPDHLRGLLGATVGLNSERKTLGILASASPKTFTPDTMALFSSSTLPLGLARVASDSSLVALVLNHTAKQWLDIEIRPRFDSFGNPVSPPLITTTNGHIIPTSSTASASATSTIMTPTSSTTFDT